jgi:nitrate/TMAO reductase-like tetraheme cytochrome c subunit
MAETRRAWAKRSVAALVVFIPAVAALAFLSIEVSSQPAFCGSCHYMAPYYESWKTSTHHDAACVECHIPPGIASEFRKKYEAVAMVARYFTGTYSTNPWAEVDDASCLRSGCHTKRVLLGKELYQGVLFDHQPHLAELRRGKRLRCTSCHSQIVQGSHMSVTANTCFLCHFKDTALNEGTGRCTVCHEVPEQMITTAGLSFNHGDVKRFRMDCVACHEGVVKGNGEVPKERCYTCHNDPERLGEYEETEFLHRAHVADHKIECLNCHIEIVHQIPAREEAVATECRNCHSSGAGHAAVRDLYRGIGAKRVDPLPAAMYLAGIRCEACHNRPANGHNAADEVSCMTCHGPKYLSIFKTWKAGLEHRVQGLSKEVQEAVQRIGATNGGVSAKMQDVLQNLALLNDGLAIHNPQYALDIIEHAHETVVAALNEAGEETPQTPPWVEASYASECLACHFGIEYVPTTAFGADFPHMTHSVSAGLRCTVCHGDMQRHGEMRIEASDCAACHERVAAPMADVAADDCLGCHSAGVSPSSEVAPFPHETHVAMGLDCSFCHAGVGDTPHLEFARSEEAIPEMGHGFCSTCHAENVPAEDGTPPEGADCTVCHDGF